MFFKSEMGICFNPGYADRVTRMWMTHVPHETKEPWRRSYRRWPSVDLPSFWEHSRQFLQLWGSLHRVGKLSSVSSLLPSSPRIFRRDQRDTPPRFVKILISHVCGTPNINASDIQPEGTPCTCFVSTVVIPTKSPDQTGPSFAPDGFSVLLQMLCSQVGSTRLGMTCHDSCAKIGPGNCKLELCVAPPDPTEAKM